MQVRVCHNGRIDQRRNLVVIDGRVDAYPRPSFIGPSLPSLERRSTYRWMVARRSLSLSRDLQLPFVLCFKQITDTHGDSSHSLGDAGS